MKSFWNIKDSELEGLYVRRCKCGLRPYFDRIDPCLLSNGCWIACGYCGRISESGCSKEEAIENWNKGIIIDGHATEPND